MKYAINHILLYQNIGMSFLMYSDLDKMKRRTFYESQLFSNYLSERLVALRQTENNPVHIWLLSVLKTDKLDVVRVENLF